MKVAALRGERLKHGGGGGRSLPRDEPLAVVSRFLGYVRGPEDNHGASGPATWANAVTAIVAANHNTIPRHVRSAIFFAALLTRRERDPISVQCLEGHLLARPLRNTGRNGHHDGDADGYAANVRGIDHIGGLGNVCGYGH